MTELHLFSIVTNNKCSMLLGQHDIVRMVLPQFFVLILGEFSIVESFTHG